MTCFEAHLEKGDPIHWVQWKLKLHSDTTESLSDFLTSTTCTLMQNNTITPSKQLKSLFSPSNHHPKIYRNDYLPQEGASNTNISNSDTSRPERILCRPSQLPQQGSDLCWLSSFPHAATSSFVLPNVYQSATIRSSQWLQIPFPHHTWITLISVVEAMPRDCKKRALLPSNLWLSSYLHMHSVPAVRVRSVETRETVLLNASKGHLQLPPLNHSIKTLGLSVGFSKNMHILRKIQSIWTT